MTTELRDKLVLVTGADRGIGKGIAIAFAQAGTRVAAHGLAGPEEAQELLAELKRAGSPEARFFGADLRDVKIGRAHV